jgi:hypothetical protein
MSVFMIVGLWLSGNGTNAGPFDLARVLVPDEARHMVWSNGFGMLDSYRESPAVAELPGDNGIAAVLYSKSASTTSTGAHPGLTSAKQQTIALLMPSVAQVQVKSISHLSDRIPSSKIDPQALDSNLMGSTGLCNADRRIVSSGKNGTKRSVSETKKKYVASQQDWKCGHCVAQLDHTFEIDHRVRLEYGGGNDVQNLIALCRNCHGKKTASENM